MNLRRMLILRTLIAFFGVTGEPVIAGPWDFDGQAELTKEKIQNFLKRAVTHFETCSHDNFNLLDWQRTKSFFETTGTKFVHCAESTWNRSYPNHNYWDS